MTDTLKQEIARALYAHEWEGQPKPGNFAADRNYWMAAATAALSVVQPRIERLEAALRGTKSHLRNLQPALNIMAREVLDDIIADHIDSALADECSAEKATSASLIALLDDPKIRDAVRVPGECRGCLRPHDRCECAHKNTAHD